jgi:hypothetical protein
MIRHDDALEARRRWALKKRRRMYRNLLKIMDADLAQMAAHTVSRRRGRRREPPSPDLALLEQFKRTIMPIVADLAELAGADKKPFLELAKPRSTRRRGPAGGA